LTRRTLRRYHAPSSSESGGVRGVLVAVAGDGVLEDDAVLGSARRMGRFANDDLDLDFGSAATIMSEAPENHTRGVGWSSRQLLSNISAMVQLMFREESFNTVYQAICDEIAWAGG
jgi:hypothetical protein